MVHVPVLRQLFREMGRPPLEAYPVFVVGGIIHAFGAVVGLHKLKTDPDLRVHRYQRVAPTYPADVLYIQPPSPHHAQLARPVHPHPRNPKDARPDKPEYALPLTTEASVTS
ncbi:hypothetical protein BGZ70_009554 [Mortierella alpina]|uniref:Uncharacterized protein n=1 Tax=Mortierella alpina TaxID=64518 RepID=A0A9P6J184_MORAP|nr:hypothetical protein BGZ70_009554 [Mortierella alpina]